MRGEVDGATVNGPVSWAPGLHTVDAGTTLRFPAGAAVPVVTDADPDAGAWSAPLTGGSEDGHSLLATYSLVLALLLGTMGLPHVLVRFYTNPDGRAARRTTLVCWRCSAASTCCPCCSARCRGSTSRSCWSRGRPTPPCCCCRRRRCRAGSASGSAALVAAGAFAAFLSTSSGLLLSVAGVLSTDLLPRKLGDFRIAAHVGGVVPIVAALGATRLDFSLTVSLAFALAASTFCPLLVLGIWWKGLTDRGATIGHAHRRRPRRALRRLDARGPRPGRVGRGAARAARARHGAARRSSSWSLVSRSTPQRVPANVGRTLLRLHAPERLGLGDARRGARPRPDRARPSRNVRDDAA